MGIYKFNDCYLDTIERRVFKNGRLIGLTPRAFDVLRLLVENAGSVVAKNDLIREVWHDSFVEEGNIPVHISKLRKLLGATKSERVIETASGVGYQFVSRVAAVGEEDWKGFLAQNHKAPKSQATGNDLRLDSIAVLPFENAGGAPELEYLAEGLTESIINNLSYIPEIKVFARNTVFRFKNSQTEAQEIGVTLGAAMVLTGRVRVIGENVIVGVELIKTANGAQLWGGHFNQPLADIFEIQEKIALSISQILRLQIGDMAKKSVLNQSPQNVHAYALYLKGRHFWARKNVADTDNAIKYFQKSLIADPTYVASYVGMIDCYFSLLQLEHLSRDETLSYVNRLLDRVAEFDEDIPEALAIIGNVRIYLEWDWKNAEICYKKSLALNPNNAFTRLRYGQMLALKGRFVDSLSQLRQALTLDPLSIMINASVGRVFWFMEQFGNAITQLKETLEIEPGNNQALLLLGAALAEERRFTESLSIFCSVPSSRKSAEVISMIGYVHALAVAKLKLRKILDE